MEAAVIDKLRNCMASALKLDSASVASIDEKTTAADVPAWTSVAHLSLILEIEKAFGVRIGNDEIASLASVSSILTSLHRKGVSS